MIQKIKKLYHTDLFRFLCVGVINTVIGYGLNLLLFNLVFWNLGKYDYWLSTFLSNACGAAVSYFLNKKFTFRSSAGYGKSIALFAAVILGCYFIAYYLAEKLLMFLFGFIRLNLGHRMESNLTILFGMCLYTALNYLGQKYIVFHKQRVPVQK